VIEARRQSRRAVRLRSDVRRSRASRIASFPPPIPQNPYQRLLYEELGRQGLELVEGGLLRLRWLLGSRHRVDVLHFHWPEIYYRHRGAAGKRALLLSWLRLPLFALRLAVARLLGYRIVWTVHQVRPHESPSPLLDRLGTRVLAAGAHVLVAHDRSTALEAAAAFGERRRPTIVPHGSYIGVYPPGRSRAEVRRELGIEPDAFLFLSLGHLRPYKGLDVLLEAVAATAESLPRAAVVVAGLPIDGAGVAELTEAAAADPRIVPLLGFVPDERVAELFGAADAAVLARTDGGTSGALVLALSHGVPVVAASRPTYVELVEPAGAGWLFEPGSAASLADALEAAAGESAPGLARRAAAARECAEALRWEDSCRTLAGLVRSAGR
jgi:glycosyltransferase involved in cell wall biosynthesis